MNNKQDNRLICSDKKRNKIRESRAKTFDKRLSQICKCYELKINYKRLNSKQKEELEMLFVEGKWFYNHVLNLRNTEHIKLSEINSTYINSVKHFDKDKNEICSELKYLNSQQKQRIITNMIANEKTIAKLVKRGFQKFGSLQFKSDFNCIPLKQYKISWSFKSKNKVKIAGIHGKILIRGTRQFDKDNVEFANANLIKKPNGYYLKITTYINRNKLPKIQRNNEILGIDFGIETNLTFSNGQKLNMSIQESDRLKKLQNELQKRVKGSKNRYKTIKLIQKEYQKQNNKKNEIANQLCSKLKKYNKIIIQDEQLSKWHEETGMSKIIQHSCMGRIKSKLKQLDNVVILDKFIPTTKWCYSCGSINNSITLKDRTLKCPNCGIEENRDIHSAKNMVEIYNQLTNKHLVPMDGRKITLIDWNSFQDEVRRCSVFS